MSPVIINDKKTGLPLALCHGITCTFSADLSPALRSGLVSSASKQLLLNWGTLKHPCHLSHKRVLTHRVTR